MLTIRQWFYRNAKIPILITIVGIILISTTYFVVWQIENHKTQLSSSNRLVDLGSLAIVQTNRVLLESVLQHAFYELHAEKVIFCKSGQVEISYPVRASSCEGESTKAFTRLIHRTAVGMPEYEFYFYVPVISNWGLLPLVGLLSGLFVLGSIATLLRINRKMNSDLLTPLMAQIQSETPMDIKELETIRQNNKKLSELKTKEAVSEAILKRNARVAHDIRDPLWAFDKLLAALPAVPDEIKGLMNNSLQRINDIARELLDQGKAKEGLNTEPISTEHLYDLVLPLVLEKRIQFADKPGIKIGCDLGTPVYGLFARIQPNEFRRALSNLINNAIQAIEGSGKVSVELEGTPDNCVIRIADDGKGIPDEILPKIGVEGFTYGKDGGSVLGLYNAKGAIESWGGSLRISSKWHEGTTVCIGLPHATPPSWFVPQIEVKELMTIVVLDDLPLLHDLWRRRFKELSSSIKLVSLTSGKQFTLWAKKHQLQSRTLFLCDYELKGEAETGLDLIMRLRISDRAILVTGHAYSAELRVACEKLGVRLLPKDLAHHVPIYGAEAKKLTSKQKRCVGGLEECGSGVVRGMVQ